MGDENAMGTAYFNKGIWFQNYEALFILDKVDRILAMHNNKYHKLQQLTKYFDERIHLIIHYHFDQILQLQKEKKKVKMFVNK